MGIFGAMKLLRITRRLTFGWHSPLLAPPTSSSAPGSPLKFFFFFFRGGFLVRVRFLKSFFLFLFLANG